MTARRRVDEGFGLIEVLISVALVAVAIVAVVGALGAGLLLATSDRNRAQGQLVMTNAAEAVRDSTQVEFVTCAADPEVERPAPAVPLKPDWAITTTYAWWNGTSFGTHCPTDPLLRDIQQVTIVVTDPAGNIDRSDVVKVAWS